MQGATFIDLFAGIGAFRIALESFGAKCVFSSEIDSHCQDTYELNHGDRPHGDIKQVNASDIPRHDVVVGGFPCQSFSISGDMKGFNDERGQLFFDIIRIVKHHKPSMILLENVANLATHDRGNTIKVIKSQLIDMGYHVGFEVLNASDFGVPHSRERIYISAFLDREPHFPSPPKNPIRLADILLPQAETLEQTINIEHYDGYEIDMNACAKADRGVWLSPVRVGKIQAGRQGERIYHPNGHSITLSSSGGGIGAKTGLYYVNEQVRRLHPRECARLMGFPDSFKISKSDHQAYRQFGNSLVIDVVQHIIHHLFSKHETIFS